MHQTASDFCFAAAKKVMEEKSVPPDRVGILVFVTQCPDYRLPATACLLQERLGLSKDCIAFDVNLGCSGFTYGLNIVTSLMKASNVDRALLLCGDTAAKERRSQVDSKHSHSAKFLFGDSGTATLLEKDEEAEGITMLSKTDGSGYKAIIKPYGGWRNPEAPSDDLLDSSMMDDVAVFNFATDEVPLLIRATMDHNHRTVEDYDCLALHQANLFILKRIAKKTGFPLEKLLISLDEFANTSSASIPISLIKRYGDENGHKIHVMSCGFGVGLSWSTADFYIEADNILPLVHTDDYFDDGYKTIE